MKKLMLLISILLCVSCATKQPVTNLGDYNMTCNQLKSEIIQLEQQVDREQNIQMAKDVTGGLISIVGSLVGGYNDSWEAVGLSLIGGDIVEDWNRDLWPRF